VSDDPVRRIADAVLYEGYILWPYRASSTKNVKRWTFGCVFPPAHSARHPDDRAALQAQCLLDADEPSIEATARFLQVVRCDGRDEAVEREVAGPFAIAAGEAEERSWQELRGALELAVEPVAERRFRVSARLANESSWDGDDREEALRHAFCSAHVVLRAQRGEFVSPREDDAGCESDGLWPVLVGERGDRSTVLAAPIVLEDYPQIAPESPGDFFDATEIDRLLIQSVLALSEAEQAEIRAGDPRARALLDRCAGLSPEQLLPLHGVFRRQS
jgi:hypothetical protein